MMAVGLAGCAPRKVVKTTNEDSVVDVKRAETTTVEVNSLIDTTKREGVEITYTKVEYYPPDEVSVVVNEPTPEVVNSPPAKGAVKSIESYTIKQESESIGVSQQADVALTSSTSGAKTEYSRDEIIEKTPASDPYKWRYIFYILLLLALSVVYIKRKSTKDWIKKAINFIQEKVAG